MKAFLSDQCKEIEENSKMGKTRDLFKKIRDTQGTSPLPPPHHGNPLQCSCLENPRDRGAWWASIYGVTQSLMAEVTQQQEGTFHAKMGTIKDRNGKDLTEAEDVKKRWQEYTEELYKKDLRDPDNQDGMVTHLQPDILE